MTLMSEFLKHLPKCLIAKEMVPSGAHFGSVHEDRALWELLKMNDASLSNTVHTGQHGLDTPMTFPEFYSSMRYIRDGMRV